MMRILFIQPTADKRGHYGLWTVKMCQAIGKTGHSLVLFTNNVYPEKYLKEEPSFKIIEMNNAEFSFEKFESKSFPLYYWWGYFRNSYIILKSALELCKREKFDVIFLTDVEYMTASIVLKTFFNPMPPVAWHVQAANFTYNTYPGSFVKKIYKVIQREVFKTVIGNEVKAFVVLGEWHKENLRQQLHINESFPMEVIPDCGDYTKSQLDKFSARRAIGIDYNGPLFLFFGMLRKDKGIDHLLDAVSHVSSNDFKLLIAGSLMDYTENQIKNLVQRFGVSNNVILRLMYVPDNEVSSYYSSCDAVIFPYPKIYTGGSGPLIKGACTYGKPVIVTDVSEMGRLVRQHGFGLLAEAENPESLADRMKEFLLLSENEKDELTRNAISLAKRNSWDAIAQKFVDFLEKIVTR